MYNFSMLKRFFIFAAFFFVLNHFSAPMLFCDDDIKTSEITLTEPKIFEIDLYSIQKKITFYNKNSDDYSALLEINLGKKTTIDSGDTVILKLKGKFDVFIPKLSVSFNNQTLVIAENITQDEFFEAYQIFSIEEDLPSKIPLELLYPGYVSQSAKLSLAKMNDLLQLEKILKNFNESKVNVMPETEIAIENETQAEKEVTDVKVNEDFEENAFSFDPSAIEESDVSLKRFKREYLQDFALPEATSIPDPLPAQAETKKIIANPNLRDKDGRTDLMKACALGNEWQVKNLLESGAKVDLQDKEGWTALMYGVRYSESLATLNLLLDANADVKILNNYGSSALLLAVSYNNNPKILSRLIDYYNSSDKELLKAFVFLLSSNVNKDYIIKEKINLFIEKEIPINSFYKGKTPLMYAAQYSTSTEVIKILLDNNAIKSIRSVVGKTVFDYAKDNSKLAHDDIYWSLNSK